MIVSRRALTHTSRLMTLAATSAMQGACAVLLAATAAAQAPPSGKAPARIPAVEERRVTLQKRAALSRELRDSVRALLDTAVINRTFPGAFVAIGDSREVLAEVSAGHLDWAPSPRPTRHTLWDIASLTKVVGTTTALAWLVDHRRVALDSAVQKYVPDWTGPNKDRVTVRHLLTHTSGLPSFKPYDRQTHDPDSLAKLLFATPLDRMPGDTMVYSDIGAFMMGQIVERITHERLDRNIARRVTRPLGMGETQFNPPRSAWTRTAPTEIDSTRGGLVHGKVHDERAYYLGGIAAHAGLFSSGADLEKFATMLLRGGSVAGTRILTRETLRQFTAYADSGRHNRALGWQKGPTAWAGGAGTLSSQAFGHTGFTGTSIAVDPAQDLYIILLSNRVNPTRDNPRITDVRSRLADLVVRIMRRYRGQTLSSGAP
jgi:serine-type D-Ala-D-Ala carboxypeptidase